MVDLSDETDDEELGGLFADGPMFSSSDLCSRCFTGLESGLTRKECSATSLGMPFILEGFQAKMSFLRGGSQ